MTKARAVDEEEEKRKSFLEWSEEIYGESLDNWETPIKPYRRVFCIHCAYSEDTR